MGLSEQEQRNIALEDLGAKIARWAEAEERFEAAIRGLFLFKITQPTQPKSVVSEPSVCLIAQGAKRLLVGGTPWNTIRRGIS